MEHDFLIGTIRFNNKTYIENINWKKRKDYIGCAYGLNKKIPVIIKKPIFVIEMKNSVNKIMGIVKINNIIIRIISQEKSEKTTRKKLQSSSLKLAY